MHGFCVRSTWVVSSIRPWLSFAAPSRKFTRPVQNIYSRSLSRVTIQKKEHALHPASRKPATTPKPEFEFTVAQIARAASQAIRVAVREGNIRDAYYVANSMLQMPLDPRINPPLRSRRLLNPINFGRPVPSRLAAHSLIHGLLHVGLTLEAGREIRKLIATGVRFHTRTLEANVNLLCSSSSRIPKDENLVNESTTEPPAPLEDSEASRILATQSSRLSSETQLALSLLSTARQSRHRRTERMYSWLVDACLLQGEIVVATLLFVILVKDWQLRRIVEPSLAEIEHSEERHVRESTEKAEERLSRLGLPSLRHAKQLRMDKRSFVIPYPDKHILQSIINSINHHILSRNRTSRLNSVESLAILASLLEQRCLPFGQMAPLLRSLQNCPSTPPHWTTVLQDGNYLDVKAYDYVHEVLVQLCQQLPTGRPNISLKNPAMIPRLDTRAYNCLIYYSLRHRLSPALADTVIEHMTVHRQPPLSPDIVTYNTLLRSATLLNRNDVASKVLEKLRLRQENSDHMITKIAPSAVSSGRRLGRVRPSKPTSFDYLRKRITAEQLDIPDFVETPRHRLLRADLHTLSSYITHLVSTGQPHVVADMIFTLLPELHVIDHPAGNSLARQWTMEQRLARRQECLVRAVEYGPFVFSALLNALSKAGKTGLAERVWLLARQAERASWIPRAQYDSPEPWCLPIHAYTSIMQCYANESKKGLACIRGSRFFSGLSASLSSMQQGPSWVPQRHGKGKIYVRGWAYFYLKMQARERGFKDVEPPLRSTTSRAVGWLLHSAMRKGAISVWQELMQVQQDRVQHYSPQWAARLQSLELPVPDSRFLNVVLDIFGRRPNMQARRVRASPSWWNRKLRITQKLFGSSGWLSLTYDHTLVEIARGMARAGYTLPIGLQRVLVGRVTFRVRLGGPRNYHVRPWAFPRRTRQNFQPFMLPVLRTNGLPLGRSRPPHVGLPRRRRKCRKSPGQ